MPLLISFVDKRESAHIIAIIVCHCLFQFISARAKFLKWRSCRRLCFIFARRPFPHLFQKRGMASSNDASRRHLRDFPSPIIYGFYWLPAWFDDLPAHLARWLFAADTRRAAHDAHASPALAFRISHFIFAARRAGYLPTAVPPRASLRGFAYFAFHTGTTLSFWRPQVYAKCQYSATSADNARRYFNLTPEWLLLLALRAAGFNTRQKCQARNSALPTVILDRYSAIELTDALGSFLPAYRYEAYAYSVCTFSLI